MPAITVCQPAHLQLTVRYRSIGIYTTVQFAAAAGNHDAKRAALDLLLILISGAPSNHAGRNSTGIWGVNRQGCRFSRPAPWMARGGGPPNHWRVTGTPSLGEVPSGGARALWLLWGFSKVTRCKSGTLGGRYRRNGYVQGPTVLIVRPSSQASQLPHLDRGASARTASDVRPPREQAPSPQVQRRLEVV
ncbi:Threonine synthase [Pseudomonas synxantha]|uniref:Threonine synthase n=1 Tax=Pseudomonas synxantha TaxID=47883 RepID=A0A3G7U426_9PSED|nr:Threonine synthase [Pseudomonas synxantha]